MTEAEDVLQLPILHTIGGREVRFHRFTMRDLVTWCSEEKAKLKREVIQRHALQPKLAQEIKNEELKAVNAKRITIGYLMALVDEPEGIEKVLRKSLMLSGEIKTEAEADAIIARMHWSEQQGIAWAAMSPPPAAPESSDQQSKEAGQNPLDGKPGETSESDTGQISNSKPSI